MYQYFILNKWKRLKQMCANPLLLLLNVKIGKQVRLIYFLVHRNMRSCIIQHFLVGKEQWRHTPKNYFMTITLKLLLVTVPSLGSATQATSRQAHHSRTFQGCLHFKKKLLFLVTCNYSFPGDCCRVLTAVSITAQQSNLYRKRHRQDGMLRSHSNNISLLTQRYWN